MTTWPIELNIQDLEGLTPLHLAVMNGNSRFVRKLLIKGSDKTIKDNNGKIPADLAREHDFINILRMLESEK